MVFSSSPILKLGLLGALLLPLACTPPKYIPQDLHALKTSEDLGLASRQAYQKARVQTDKNEILKYAHAGIVYSEKCLKFEPQKPICLYYNVLNRGLYIKNHVVNYQKSLKLMIQNCITVLDVDPGFEEAGCYRILGNIYAQAPSFSLDPKNITRDLEKSSEYLQKSVQLAPQCALNHLFFARTLLELDEISQAQNQLKEFDRLRTSNLDNEFPEWKIEREKLARKLH